MRNALEVDTESARSPFDGQQSKLQRNVLIAIGACVTIQTVLYIIQTFTGTRVWMSEKERKFSVDMPSFEIPTLPPWPTMQSPSPTPAPPPVDGGIHTGGDGTGGQGGYSPGYRPTVSPVNPFMPHEGDPCDGTNEYTFKSLSIDSSDLIDLFTIYKTDFMNLWVDSKTHLGLFLAEFELSAISGDMGGDHSDPLSFGVGAIFAKGMYAHMDATDGGVVFNVHISKDKHHIDILQPKLWLEKGEQDYEPMESAAREPRRLAKLKILGLRHQRINGECKVTHVVAPALELIARGFFVVGHEAAMMKRLGKSEDELLALATQRIKEAKSSGADLDADSSSSSMFSMPVVKQSTIKAFQKNIDFTVDYETGSIGQAQSIEEQAETYREGEGMAVIRYCVYHLNSRKVMPRRLADDRVGYFHQRFEYLGDYGDVEGWKDYRKDEAIDPVVNIIQRHWLKEENNYEIKYYVDYTVPQAYREATKKGIEMWQKAFDALDDGAQFKPKIIGLAPGDDGFPSDYDPADFRFNSISWATGDAESIFAIGQSVVDPRTGEILKANIVVTLGWLQSWLGEELFYFGGVPAVAAEVPFILADETLDADSFLDGPVLNDLESSAAYGNNVSSASPSWFPKDSKQWPCRHHGSSLHQRHPFEGLMCRALYDRSFPLLMANTQDPDAIKKYLAAAIQSTISHEVGHTLGLRHNFRGSTAYTVEQLQDKNFVAQNGLGSSVMDYYASNVRSKAKVGDDQPEPFSLKVGAYDVWAIKYGYTPIPDETCCTKNSAVVAIAEEYTTSLHKEFSFATDSDARGIGVDPYTALYDLGKEPAEYFEDKIQLFREASSDFVTRTVKNKEAFTRMARAMFQLILWIWRTCMMMTHYIGGLRLSNVYAAQDCPADLDSGTCLPSGHPKPVELVESSVLDTVLSKLLEVLKIQWFDLDFHSWSVRKGAEFYSVQPFQYGSLIARAKQILLSGMLRADRLDRIHEYYGSTALSDTLMSMTEGLLGITRTEIPSEFPELFDVQFVYISKLVDLGNCDGMLCPNDMVATIVITEALRLKSAFELLSVEACKVDGKGGRNLGTVTKPQQCAFFTRSIAKLETITQFHQKLTLSLGPSRRGR